MFGTKTEDATATDIIILPIIPVGRHPHLLHRAEASGASIREELNRNKVVISYH